MSCHLCGAELILGELDAVDLGLNKNFSDLPPPVQSILQQLAFNGGVHGDCGSSLPQMDKFIVRTRRFCDALLSKYAEEELSGKLRLLLLKKELGLNRPRYAGSRGAGL